MKYKVGDRVRCMPGKDDSSTVPLKYIGFTGIIESQIKGIYYRVSLESIAVKLLVEDYEIELVEKGKGD